MKKTFITVIGLLCSALSFGQGSFENSDVSRNEPSQSGKGYSYNFFNEDWADPEVLNCITQFNAFGASGYDFSFDENLNTLVVDLDGSQPKYGAAAQRFTVGNCNTTSIDLSQDQTIKFKVRSDVDIDSLYLYIAVNHNNSYVYADGESEFATISGNGEWQEITITGSTKTWNDTILDLSNSVGWGLKAYSSLGSIAGTLEFEYITFGDGEAIDPLSLLTKAERANNHLVEYEGYEFNFEGTTEDNCLDESFNIFSTSGYSFDVDETNHYLQLELSGNQGEYSSAANHFYKDDCNEIYPFQYDPYAYVEVRLRSDVDVEDFRIMFAGNVEGDFALADGNAESVELVGDNQWRNYFLFGGTKTWQGKALGEFLIGWGITAKGANMPAGTIEFEYIRFGTAVTDLPPYLKKDKLEDQNLDEDFTAYDIDLTNYFSDRETEGEDMGFDAIGDQGAVNVSISNGIATISSTENWFGTEEIVITATDSEGNEVSDTVIFNVAPVNDEPMVENAISDYTLDQDFNDFTIDLQSAFEDIETADEDFIFSVAGNNNIKVSISNGIATISSTQNWFGIENVTFTAEDEGGLSVSDEVKFTVNEVDANTAPFVESSLGQQDLQEDFSDYLIDLKEVFGDLETSDANLIYTFSTPSKISINATGGLAVISSKTGETGIDLVTFTVEDEGGLTVSETVIFNIEADNGVNDQPTVTNPIEDQVILQNFEDYTINLKNTFGDIETSDANLIYTVSGNSDIQVSITNGIATISSTMDWFGTETITFTAEDEGGLTVSDEVLFTVNEKKVTGMELEASSAIKLYPVPAQDLLNVEAEGVESVTIYSIQGETVASFSKGENLNISTLASGNYVVEVKHQNGVSRQMIVKD